MGSAVAAAAAAYTSGGVTRVAGADRYATAARISASGYLAGVPTVYVATGEGFADALAGVAVAGRDRAPVLLVKSGAMPFATDAELTRLRPGRIVILGGTVSVDSQVEAALATYTSGPVTRLAGVDRYATAVAISAASYTAGGPTSVYLSTGSAFPDSLAAGPPAGLDGDPILLVSSSRLPASVADEIRRLDPSQVIVVGGPASISEAVRAELRALLG